MAEQGKKTASENAKGPRAAWRAAAATRRDAVAKHLKSPAKRKIGLGNGVYVAIESAEVVTGPYFGRDRAPDGRIVERLLVPEGETEMIIRFNATRGPEILRTADDPLIIDAPPTMVPDGDEPNPDYNPDDPDSPSRRPVYREDVGEALRFLIASIIERRTGVQTGG